VIVVDSSVWISHLRGTDSSAVRQLRSIDDPQDILIGVWSCWRFFRAREQSAMPH
jgi:predicted nucleic acid-binding protein